MRTRLLKKLRKEAYELYKIECDIDPLNDKVKYYVRKSRRCDIMSTSDLEYAKRMLIKVRRNYILSRVSSLRTQKVRKILEQKNKEYRKL